jgi:hypothetical protein
MKMKQAEILARLAIMNRETDYPLSFLIQWYETHGFVDPPPKRYKEQRYGGFATRKLSNQEQPSCEDKDHRD